MSDVIWELDWSSPEAVRAVFSGSDSGGEPPTGGGDPAAEPEEWTGVGLGSLCPASSTNRRGANRQPVEDRGGEDTADWGWLVEWPGWKLEELRGILGRAQKAAQADDLAGAVVQMGSLKFLVRPGGVRIGGLYFSWVLEFGGWSLAIMDREKPWGETPNVRVHVGAVPLMMWGLEEVYQSAKGCLEAEAGKIQGEKISRMDACLDLKGVPVAEFVEPMVRGCVVRRGRDFGVFGSGLKLTGFTCGKGSIVLRVYDKVAECMDSGVKWDLMLAHRYGGEVPVEATRVEFQLRRDALREFQVETVAEWIEKRGAVLDYLVGSWFRITDGPADRSNTQRFGPSELWQRVSEGFAGWAGPAVLPAERVRLPRAILEIGPLVRQAVGCLTTAAAVRGRSLKSWGDILRWVLDVGEWFEEELTRPVLERFEGKRVRVDAAMCFG